MKLHFDVRIQFLEKAGRGIWEHIYEHRHRHRLRCLCNSDSPDRRDVRRLLAQSGIIGYTSSKAGEKGGWCYEGQMWKYTKSHIDSLFGLRRNYLPDNVRSWLLCLLNIFYYSKVIRRLHSSTWMATLCSAWEYKHHFVVDSTQACSKSRQYSTIYPIREQKLSTMAYREPQSRYSRYLSHRPILTALHLIVDSSLQHEIWWTVTWYAVKVTFKSTWPADGLNDNICSLIYIAVTGRLRRA